LFLMSTRATASAIFPVPIEDVWKVVRDFSAVPRHFAGVSDVAIIDGTPTTIGATRVIKWKTGEEVRQQLVELSELTRTITWETVQANFENDASSVTSTIRLHRITETKGTLVEWSAEYSADASPSFLAFEKRSFEDNLIEIRTKLTGIELPILYHIPEAPSTRVIWICAELGVPIRIKESTPSKSPQLRRSSGSISAVQGGLMTSFVEGDTTILESGAIVFYLLEKYDNLRKLSPPIGNSERAKFLSYFFNISSTLDNLVFDAYKMMYVEQRSAEDDDVQTKKEDWERLVNTDLIKQVKHNQFICGNTFSACDIMAGWTLYVANLLGWLDSTPELKQYLDRISKRPAFQKAFSPF